MLQQLLYFLDVQFPEIQQLNIKPKMTHTYDQQIFDVLDLGDSQKWNNNLSYGEQDQQIDFQEYYQNLQDVKEKIQELPPTNQTQDICQDEQIQEEQFLSEKNEQQFTQNIVQTLYETPCKQIQFSEQKINVRNLVLKGYDYETQNIGKLLKFSTSSFLNLSIKTRDLDPLQEKVAKEFTSSIGSLQNFKQLFQVEGLSQKCREYYESKVFIQTIMTSSKMDMRSKLKMLRHLQKFHQMTFKEPEKWRMLNF